MAGWRKLHKELHSSYILPNIVRVTQLRHMRWARSRNRKYI